ncbi:hypothetical protein K3495_g6752 [Podosphaera aphanis]|nr:hypothetical protein K3495_g6752 [Podosphaera aphanis]
MEKALDLIMRLFSLILLKLHFATSSKQGPCLPPRFNIKKANWDLFKKNLSSLESSFTHSLSQAISKKDADKVAALLQEIILKAAEDSIPKSKPSSYSKSWWNEELTNLRRESISLC